MKTIINVFNGIADNYRYNKAAFIMMMLGIVLSSYMMVYSYGNFNTHLNASLDGVDSRRYSAPNDGTYGKKTIEEIEEYDYSEYGVIRHALTQYISSEALNTVILSDGRVVNGDAMSGTVTVIATDDDKNEYKPFSGRCQFDESDPDNAAVLPCTENTQNLKFNKETNSYGSVFINNVEFTVIGVSTDFYDLIIRYDTFKKLGFEPDYVQYYTKELLEQDKSDELRDKIWTDYNIDPDNSMYSSPYDFYNHTLGQYREYAVIIFCAFLISLVSYALYMMYFIEKSERARAISMICGASKKHMLFYMLAQNLIICLSAFALTLILHSIIGNTFDMFAGVRYTVKDMAFMLITVIVSSLILSMPNITRILASSPSQLSRKSA